MSAFDNERYLEAQKKSILQRVQDARHRLYLEFGGKLLGDFHAARVLPGYEPDVKVRLLRELSSNADIIVCIHSGDIASHKIRADFGITYDKDAMRLIDELRNRGIDVTGVVVTRYAGEPEADEFKSRLEKHGIKTYLHRSIKGYPSDLEHIASAEGFGSNPYIEVTQPLVVVTGPGPNSGKMGTCLSQMYHEYVNGKVAQYAKFETFPVWNLPLQHPVNIAYEAATAELHDMNAMDSFHFEAYGKTAVNYNRDLQTFPLLKSLLKRIAGEDCWYRSPTDMGVNCLACGIVDDQEVQEAAKREIARRYFTCYANFKQGKADEQTLQRLMEVSGKAGVVPEEREVVIASRKAAADCQAKGKGNRGVYCGAAVRLNDGTIITGKNSTLMHSPASMIINAIKYLAGIPDAIHLLQPDILESVANFKDSLNSRRYPGMDVSETLIALVVSANGNPCAKMALDCIQKLRHCDMHLTHIPSPGDEAGLRRLGCSYTYEPVPPSKDLFN